MDKRAYLKEYRRTHHAEVVKHRLQQKARLHAMRALAQRHPVEYTVLLEQAVRELGL